MTKILGWLARRTLSRYDPIIVGITGSAGKTSTKNAVLLVLGSRWSVRGTEKNYNTEIGVPLAIIGASHGGRNTFRWVRLLVRAVFRLIVKTTKYPDVLVLEMAADRPGDIGYLARLAPPHIGVLTVIGETPVHVEFFAGPKSLALEKAKLIEALPGDGYAILNADDPMVMELAPRTPARVLTYGFGPEADIRITNYELRIRRDATSETAEGISFKLEYQGSVVPVRLTNVFGQQQAYVVAAAAGVGIAFGLHLVEIVEALAHYEPEAGRLRLIPGKAGSLILDDTYNASPVATLAALDVLARFPAKRRIAVLGDMRELGKMSRDAHRRVGERVADVADIFIAVGDEMKAAVEAILEHERGRTGRLTGEVFAVGNAFEAGRKLAAMVRPGDVALVKGSQGVRMERVVKAAMAHPERAGELLVRQTVDWLQRETR